MIFPFPSNTRRPRRRLRVTVAEERRAGQQVLALDVVRAEIVDGGGDEPEQSAIIGAMLESRTSFCARPIQDYVLNGERQRDFQCVNGSRIWLLISGKNRARAYMDW